MKIGTILAIAIAAIAAVVGVYLTDIDRTANGRLSVVSIKGGELQEYGVDPGGTDLAREARRLPGSEDTGQETGDLASN